MIKQNDTVYFVENIITNEIDNKENTYVILQRVSEKFDLNSKEENDEFIEVEMNKNSLRDFSEGQYVYLNDNTLSNANSAKYAKRNIYFNNLYRGKLLKQQTKEDRITDINSNAKIYSYHVNVGHGNCSIVVIVSDSQVNLWLIDCSNMEMVTKKPFQVNIDKCLSYITTKFEKKEIVFQKCFITHNHYDHYSGVINLIEKGLINGNTVFYLNVHYAMSSDNLTKLFKKLFEIRATVIEPISQNSNANIGIWHPLKRTIRTKTPKYNGQVVEVEPHPNNSSSVLYFNFNSKSILFTGDIETEGWNKITNCCKFLQNSDYYVISHHGSINGHLRTVCPVKNSISNLSNCVKPNSTQILMGRDKAFSGIYSSQVTSDFNNIFCTEKDSKGIKAKFLEIDWQSNVITHYY